MYKVTVPVYVTNGHFNREKTLNAVRRCKAERIALAIDRELDEAFSSEKNLRLLKELIAYYRENGLEVMVWLGETLGHSGETPQPGAKYTHIRTIDHGEVMAFCPMDEAFTRDFCSWVKKIASCGAEMIMLDDDFRLGYRSVSIGCCCPKHLQALEAVLHEHIPENELRQRIFHGGKNRTRDAWLRVQRDAMCRFSKALRDALDEVNPAVRLGFCCVPSSWDAEGWDPIEMSKIMAGKTKPFMRLSGAPYWVPGWVPYRFSLGEVIEIERTQINRCKNSGIEIFSEGDTYPRPRQTCPAAYLECFDEILRADGNADGILKYMLPYISDPDDEPGYVDAAVEHTALYAELAAAFSSRRCVGFRPYNAAHLVEQAEYNADTPEVFAAVQRGLLYPSLRFAVDNSLPVTYERGHIGLLFGENARSISEEELADGNIIDITAAKILMRRGIDVGIARILSENDEILHKVPAFSGVPQEYFLEADRYARLHPVPVGFAEIERKADTQLLSFVRFTEKIIADGVFRYENAAGMRFLVFPFDAGKAKNQIGWLNSYARKHQLLSQAEWLGKKPLDAVVEGDHPGLYCMVKKEGHVLSVDLWNLGADKINAVRVKLGNPFDCASVRFLHCTGHSDGGTVVLDSVLYPYEFAGFELSELPELSEKS